MFDAKITTVALSVACQFQQWLDDFECSTTPIVSVHVDRNAIDIRAAGTLIWAHEDDPDCELLTLKQCIAAWRCEVQIASAYLHENPEPRWESRGLQ